MLITHHWDSIAAILLRNEPYLALVNDCEDSDETGQDWTVGFIQGMRLRENSWQRLVNDEEAGAILRRVMVLVQDEDHSVASQSVTQEDRNPALEAFEPSVLFIYRYFRNEAKPQSSAKKRTAVKPRTGKKKR